MWPWFTASTLVCRSALPVSIMRTVSGDCLRTSLSSSMPFMPGMRISEMTTAKGPFRASTSSAS